MPIVRHRPSVVKVGLDPSLPALDEDPGGRAVMVPVAYLRDRLGRGLIPIFHSYCLEGVMLIEDDQ